MNPLPREQERLLLGFWAWTEDLDIIEEDDGLDYNDHKFKVHLKEVDRTALIYRAVRNTVNQIWEAYSN